MAVLVTWPLRDAPVAPVIETVTVTPVPPVVASALPVWLLPSAKTSQLSRPVVILQPEAAIAGRGDGERDDGNAPGGATGHGSASHLPGLARVVGPIGSS